MRRWFTYIYISESWFCIRIYWWYPNKPLGFPPLHICFAGRCLYKRMQQLFKRELVHSQSPCHAFIQAIRTTVCECIRSWDAHTGGFVSASHHPCASNSQSTRMLPLGMGHAIKQLSFALDAYQVRTCLSPLTACAKPRYILGEQCPQNGARFLQLYVAESFATMPSYSSPIQRWLCIAMLLSCPPCVPALTCSLDTHSGH